MTDPIRVIVVDDSPFVCRLLTAFLDSSPKIQVVSTALDGKQAVELVNDLRPDTVTLDLEMPEMNGLAALEHIMHECPTPVVLVSGVSRQAAAVTLQALDIGAVDFVFKYTPGLDTNPEVLRQEIVAKVIAASQIKVIRTLRPSRLKSGERDLAKHAVHPPNTTYKRDATFEVPGTGILASPFGVVIVIGASTGGPIAVRELLSQLPVGFRAAVIIVQHMPATFTHVLAAQLDRQVAYRVKEAEPGDRLEPGLALVAPGNYHLLVKPDTRVELNQAPEFGGHRPSVDVTMQSVAQIFGAHTNGVILSGMGDDGALGMLSIRAKGGKTFAQDAESCVVDGMPQRAIERGAVDHVASPEEIGQMLRMG